jgi:hypothetical protein
MVYNEESPNPKGGWVMLECSSPPSVSLPPLSWSSFPVFPPLCLSLACICAGRCPFCQVEMEPIGDYLRGPCFHGFHANCFLKWLAWYQQDWQERVNALSEQAGHLEVARSLGVCSLPPDVLVDILVFDGLNSWFQGFLSVAWCSSDSHTGCVPRD